MMKRTTTLVPISSTGLLCFLCGILLPGLFSSSTSSTLAATAPFAPGTLVEKNFVTGEIVRSEEHEDGSFSYVIEWDLAHAPNNKKKQQQQQQQEHPASAGGGGVATRSANNNNNNNNKNYFALSSVEVYESSQDVAAMVEEAADEEDPDIDPISEGTPVIKYVHDERGQPVMLRGMITHHDSYYYTIHYDNGKEELLDRDVDQDLILQMVNDARSSDSNAIPYHTLSVQNEEDASPEVKPIVTIGDDAKPAPEYEFFSVGTHVRTTIDGMEWFGVIAKRDAVSYTINFHDDSSRKYDLHDPDVAAMVEAAESFQYYKAGTRVADRLGRQGRIYEIHPGRADLTGVMKYTISWDDDGSVETFTTFPIVMEMVEMAQLKKLISSSSSSSSGQKPMELVLDNDEVIWPIGTHVRATLDGKEWFGVIAKQEDSGYTIHFHDGSIETYPLEDPEVDEMVLAAKGFRGYPVGTLVRDSRFQIGEISFADHPSEYVITWRQSGQVDRFTTFPLVAEMVESAQKYCSDSACEEDDASSSTTNTVIANTEWTSGWSSPESSEKVISSLEKKDTYKSSTGIIVGVLVAVVTVIAVAHRRRRAQQKRIQRGGVTHFSVEGDVI